MARNRIAWGAVLLGLAALPTEVMGQGDDSGRLYGMVTTLDGEVYQGFIRWDQNEGHWVDVLDASKRIPSRYVREAQELSGRTVRSGERGGVRIMGFRVGGRDVGERTSTSALRFGHVHKIHVLDDDYALITLRSGEEQELRARSTDLGQGNRGIVVYDADRGEVELDWDDLDFVEFAPAPRTASPLGERLFGTVETRRGGSFTGWITWDMDEIFAGDELDGQDGRRRRAIRFEEINRIERLSSSRSLVVTRGGEEVELRGTNDVNSGNRGILVGDPGLGQVRIEWDDFRAVDFSPAPAPVPFDGGRRLRGTVATTDGQTFTGTIRWDNDEEWSWEMLDGETGGIEIDVEFGMIRTIERASSRTVDVTLTDGRRLELRGSNDVNDENRGIFVTLDDGSRVMIGWEDFERVEFMP